MATNLRHGAALAATHHSLTSRALRAVGAARTIIPSMSPACLLIHVARHVLNLAPHVPTRVH